MRDGRKQILKGPEFNTPGGGGQPEVCRRYAEKDAPRIRYKTGTFPIREQGGRAGRGRDCGRGGLKKNEWESKYPQQHPPDRELSYANQELTGRRRYRGHN